MKKYIEVTEENIDQVLNLLEQDKVKECYQNLELIMVKVQKKYPFLKTAKFEFDKKRMSLQIYKLETNLEIQKNKNDRQN